MRGVRSGAVGVCERCHRSVLPAHVDAAGLHSSIVTYGIHRGPCGGIVRPLRDSTVPPELELCEYFGWQAKDHAMGSLGRRKRRSFCGRPKSYFIHAVDPITGFLMFPISGHTFVPPKTKHRPD
jgi:hypothetical protein